MAKKKNATGIFLSDLQWKAIMGGIREQQCVVFIGSEIFSSNEQKLPQSQRLARYLIKQQQDLNIRVYENGWFHLREGGTDGIVCEAIREFYKKEASEYVNGLLEQLAQIKFHLFVSMTPDYHLRSTFERLRLPHRPGAYIRKEPDRSNDKPTADIPVIYNMLGELNNRNSLVLTYDDFYDYMESVFIGKSMSTLLKDYILEAQYFLFLGMPFDQWYMHLFMRILRQHQEQRQKTKLAANTCRIPDDSEICWEQYHIKLVNSNIAAFVQELYNRCKDASLLRELPLAVASLSSDHEEQKAAFISDLYELLSENAFERILNKLRETLRNVGAAGRELMIKVVNLSGQHKSIRDSDLNGILSFDEKMKAINKLRLDFVHVIDDLQENWTTLNIRL